MVKIIESDMLDKHEGVEYLYVFHDLVSHKDGTDLHYVISKTNYFVSDKKFYKQDEMLLKGLDAKDFKDESACFDHIGKLNELQLKAVQKRRRELYKIQKSAPSSSSILELIEFHDEVIGVYLEWFNKKNIPIYPKIRSSGRPKGSRNKLTTKRYTWIRDKYYFLKEKSKAHTVDEFARLMRSQLNSETPDWWGKPIYSIETIKDIIKKQKWGD